MDTVAYSVLMANALIKQPVLNRLLK
jgi:delta-aminolevulinic acid dehydratase/porphobilinogen synthase